MTLALLGSVTPAVAQRVNSLDTPQVPLDALAIVADNYKPIGGRVGTFLLYPEGAVTANVTDNVLATDQAKRSDFYVDADAGFRLVRSAIDRRVVLQADVGRDFHANVPAEDRTRFGGRGFVRIGAADDTRWEFALSGRQDSIDRESVNNVQAARSPVQFLQFGGDAARYLRRGRYGFGVGITVARSDYQTAYDRSGGRLDQRYRNLTLYGGRGEVSYELRPGISALGKVSFDWLDYDLGPSDAGFIPGVDRNRDSKRYRAEVGARFSISDRLYGDATVGYSRRDYVAQLNPIKDVGGISFASNVIWQLTPSTSVHIDADRLFLESASRTIAGYRATGGGVRIDHSPAPALVLSATVNYRTIDPIGDGVNRDEYGALVEVTRFLSRRYRIVLQARHGGRTSDDPLFSYKVNYGGASLKATF